MKHKCLLLFVEEVMNFWPKKNGVELIHILNATKIQLSTVTTTSSFLPKNRISFDMAYSNTTSMYIIPIIEYADYYIFNIAYRVMHVVSGGG